MATGWLRSVFEGVILLSTVASALVLWLSHHHHQRRSPEPVSSRFSRLALLRHPLTLFAIVCLLIFVNQIAFNAYVLRVHGGDASFVARYLPGGWFALSRGPVVRLVASHVGNGHILAPSVLNVQAFLELPFVITAYLSVARMLGGRVYAALTRLPVLLLASASFTVTFSLVELSVPNPWTFDDIVIRAIAGVTVPCAMAWIARGDRSPLADVFRSESPNTATKNDRDRPRGVLGLFAFLAGAAAIASAVLAMYDAFLLYNFAHLDQYAIGLVVAGAVAIASSWAAPRIDSVTSRAHNSAVVTCTRDALATFTVIFFVPSLVLRYQAFRPIAFACGLLIVAFAFVVGLRRGIRRMDLGLTEILRLIFCGLVGLVSGGVAALVAIIALSNSEMPEGNLAVVAIVFLGTTLIAARAVETMMRYSRLRQDVSVELAKLRL